MLIITEYGLELEENSIADADAIVILGGMAMPQIGVKPNENEKSSKPDEVWEADSSLLYVHFREGWMVSRVIL